MTGDDRGALAPGLEQRIAELEDARNEGADLTSADWLALALGSIGLPLLLILWGALA
jgi:hypothetical protein